MITLLLILSLHAQTFIPKFGGGGTPPPANGLLNSAQWYVEADQASGGEPPESALGCCAGNNFQEVGGSWGSTTGVITNSRTAGAATSLFLNYDYGGGGDFTVAGWFNLNSTATTQVLVSSWDIGAGFELAREFDIRYITGTGAIELKVAHQGAVAPLTVTTVSMTPSPAVSAGNWFFVVGGFDDTGNILFLTCEERSSVLPALTTTAFVGAMQTVSMGVSLGTQIDSGVPDLVNNVISSGSAVDAWGYWLRVLSGAQIDLLYAETPWGSFTF